MADAIDLAIDLLNPVKTCMEGDGQNETGIDQPVIGVTARPGGLDMISAKRAAR